MKVQGLATMFLALGIVAALLESAEPELAIQNRAPLAPNVFPLLPLKSIRPTGWLRDQLVIQANGLSGHLDEFWPDLVNSAWIGGSGEGWERGPYYLDGLVPLAYELDDPTLIAKVKKWMDWTLNNQQPNGMLGPKGNTDWWPNYVMLKAMTQYQEATGDFRVIPAMQKYFAYQLSQLDEHPLKEWAIFRWHDEVVSVLWLYNRAADPKLLDLAHKLHAQGHDWEAQYAQFGYTDKVQAPNIGLASHGVNNGMALKAAAVWSEITGAQTDRDAALHMLKTLDEFHGQPNGMFSCDEHLAGKNPSQGTELCTVVETMYSLETELSVLGSPMLADRLEKITFNSLPGTFTPDMWGHQYDQQANQVLVSLGKRDWSSNGPDSNIFGLEPNFGCCTANMHQGWPKFVASLWMANSSNGLAAVAYAPNELKTTVSGVRIAISEQTDYPFRDSIRITMSPARAVAFPLQLHIPEWARQPVVKVNGTVIPGAQSNTFFTVNREWRKGDRVDLSFPMTIEVKHGYHNSVSVERGPLVYSLKIGEQWRKEKQTGPATDFEVFPTTPWNYALRLNAHDPSQSFHIEERAIGKQPFSPDGAPVVIRAEARRLPEWTFVDDSAAPLPVSPVQSKQPLETVTLIPYAAAKLRLTALPYLTQ